AAFVSEGRILGLIPKMFIPNYNEFYEVRHFAAGFGRAVDVKIGGQTVKFGSDILFRCTNMKDVVIGAEICEDLWTPMPPSIRHAMNGATILVNCSASNETVSKDAYRRELVSGQSARLVSAYVYASAGEGESTQDLVFSGHNIIAENGTVLSESRRFTNEAVYADIDLAKLTVERRRMNTFGFEPNSEYTFVDFQANVCDLDLIRHYAPTPFVPANEQLRAHRCETILSIQSMGLKKRLVHTGCKCAVIGISGGLDSTLALLVTAKAFDLAGIDRKGIIAVTMPGFGTTDRTYQNAVKLTHRLKATLREVDIKEAVTLHFKDIGHDINVHNVTYENGQARERTQILMDIANKEGGMVIGTGDMSELALGWATYNGDHMSMYGVNASVPKTLVRHVVRYYADTCKDEELNRILLDVLDTPVSPELLPPEDDGTIAQKTEDLVGPYELHDFFMYHILRFGVSPKKLYRIAGIAFEGMYDDETILKWEKVFYRRFFAQQFKRSCLPDGPKVGSVAVSPRGDLRMPSDACGALWLAELENM
ncbi:MAG: NAD(+) synthase, partial [Lachnospiraceae bacterium]